MAINAAESEPSPDQPSQEIASESVAVGGVSNLVNLRRELLEDEADISELLDKDEIKAYIENIQDDGSVEITDIKASLEVYDLDPQQEARFIQHLNGLDITILGQPEEDTFAASAAVDSSEAASTMDMLQLFLNEVGKHQLLTPAEEVRLAKQKDIYLPYMLTPEDRRGKSPEEQELLFHDKIDHLTKAEQQAVLDGKIAFDKMMNCNLRLVISIAKRYQGRGLGLLDLIQEGTTGLQRAIVKFDWRKGYKLSTYATWWIRQACQRATINQGEIIRIPVHVQERIQKIKRLVYDMSLELGEYPSTEELKAAAAEDGILPKQFDEAYEAMLRTTESLDQPLKEDSDSSALIDFVASQREKQVDEEALEGIRRAEIIKAIQSLPEQQRRVLELRFGFTVEEPLTLEEIGRVMGGKTRERIRQIEGEGLRRLALMPGFKEAALGIDSVKLRGNDYNGTRLDKGYAPSARKIR